MKIFEDFLNVKLEDYQPWKYLYMISGGKNTILRYFIITRVKDNIIYFKEVEKKVVEIKNANQGKAIPQHKLLSQKEYTAKLPHPKFGNYSLYLWDEKPHYFDERGI